MVLGNRPVGLPMGNPAFYWRQPQGRNGLLGGDPIFGTVGRIIPFPRLPPARRPARRPHRKENNAMADLIKVELVDGIQTITINRPDARNAINLETARAMAAALDDLDNNPAARIGILTGANNTFSSGMDLKAFAQSGERPLIPGRGFAGLNEAPPKKPLIAAVEGYALAGGFE